MTQVSEDKVWQALSRVIEPDFKKDLVTLKMVEDLKIEGGKVSFTIVLTTPACPLKDEMKNACNDALSTVDGVTQTEIAFTARTTAGTFTGKAAIPGVRNVLAVSSGKGGVGKSTTAVNLAIALKALGAKVGIMDADVYGPNIPMMLGINTPPKQAGNRFVPPSGHGITCMSMAFMVPPGTPLIWRGPMLHGVIQQFIRDVEWGELDYLIVDMPPGTGDAQLSLAQLVPLSGTIIVTTPQEVALSDSRRGLAMFQKVNVPILGIVENMSSFVCPHCHEETPIFSRGGGEAAAKELGVPFLGRIPIDLSIREGGDQGMPIAIGQPTHVISTVYKEIAGKLASAISILNAGAKPIQIAGFS